MTRHNLDQHLQWLLQSTCSAPTTNIITPPQSAPVRAGVSNLEPEIPLRELSSSAPDLGVTDKGHASEIRGSSGFLHPAIPAHPGRTKEGADMARLQSGPRSATKAKLLSDVSPDPSQLPTPRTAPSSRFSLADQYSAAYGEREGSGFSENYLN